MSEGASLGRQRGAQREERARVCQWAEGESTSGEDWMEQQHSPSVLTGGNSEEISFAAREHKNTESGWK